MKTHFCGLFALAMGLMLSAAAAEQAGPGGAAQFTGEAGKVAAASGSDLAAAVAESAGYRDGVMKIAASHKGKPYLVQQGEYLVIGNDRVAAVFRAGNNELAGLVDVQNGGNILAYGNGPLWKIYLVDSAKKPAGFIAWEATQGRIEVASLAAGSAQHSRSWRGAKLTLTWDDISVADEKNVLSVQATVTAEAGSPYLKWNITADNRSGKLGVWQVDFPRLESIMPMGETARTHLFVPWNQGRVHDNPFARDEQFMGQYPAPSAPMQYSAIYGSEGGLFLATHDGKMYLKQFVHECRKNSATVAYYLRNLPENRGNAGVGFNMPYDFVLTSFKGDWFDAARLYREWAVKQVWCSGGPLATRKDVPEWFKRLTFWEHAWEDKTRQTVEDVKTIAATMGVPYATDFYGWSRNGWNTGEGGVEDYFPPLVGDEEFKTRIRMMQDAGARIMPYVVPLWAKQLDSYKKRDVFRYCIKDAAGNSYGWRIDMEWRHKNIGDVDPVYWLDWPCASTEFFQNEMAAISRKLVGDYGVDGIYYDVLSGNAQTCFDPNHGHTMGGGNYWATGNRALLRRSRQAIREVNPEAIMVSECPSEAYLDVLDGFLLFGGAKIFSGSVPAFQTVYHDYFVLYGNYLGTQQSIDHLPMLAGESLLDGDQLGIFNVWPMFLPGHPRKELAVYWKDEAQRQKNVDFLKHIARLRYNSGYKFLAIGEKQRDLTLTNALPIKEVVTSEGNPDAVRRMPAVINSVWKAADGTLGLVFCNITETEQQAGYTIDMAVYSLPAGQGYVVRELQDNGASRVVGRHDQAVFSRVETIPARRAVILEISPE